MRKNRPAEHEPVNEPTQLPATLQWAVVVVVIVFFVVMAAANALSTSATADEPVHLAAGYSYLEWGDFRINPEHPPLAKMIAALPLILGRALPDDFNPGAESGGTLQNGLTNLRLLRTEFARLVATNETWFYTQEFFYGATDATLSKAGVSRTSELPTTIAYPREAFVRDADAMFHRARLSMLIFGVALCLIVFLWARELHGFAGGVIALLLIALDPNFLGHSGLVTTDVAASFGFCAATWLFWRATRRLTIGRAVALALSVAIAALLKFSTVLLAPIFLVIGVISLFSNEPWPIEVGQPRTFVKVKQRALGIGALLLFCGLVTYVSIWAAYGFRYSAANDPERAAKLETSLAPGTASAVPFREPGRMPVEWLLRRAAADRELLARWPDGAPLEETDRLARTIELHGAERLLLLVSRNHLLPEAFVTGLAHVRFAFLRSSFLMGKYSNTGFRSYFLWSFLLKTTMPALALVVLAFLMRRHLPDEARRALPFLLVPVAIYVIVSIGATLNIGHRHLFPIYPFLYIFAGGIAARWAKMKEPLRTRVALVVPACVAIASLLVLRPPWNPQPLVKHHLSYFNEIAGGPARGSEWLVDSNLDWGQDLPALAEWAKAHPDERIYLGYFGSADPRWYGFPFVNLEGSFEDAPHEPLTAIDRPGTIAISVTNLRGVLWNEDLRARWREVIARSEPVGSVGYSIVLYKVKPK